MNNQANRTLHFTNLIKVILSEAMDGKVEDGKV